MSLADALKALQSNKGDYTDTFRRIFTTNAKFEEVKLSLKKLEECPLSVFESPIHLTKYVKLLLCIVEQRSHLDHFKFPDWTVSAVFLVNAIQALTDSLHDFELIKCAKDAFCALSLLMQATENINVANFPDILNCCQFFMNSLHFRENSCSPYLMRIIRLLVQFGFMDAEKLGNDLMKLEKPRNPILRYEMFTFSCFIPQSVSLLKLLGSSSILIRPEEVEFDINPRFGFLFPCFQPSSDAELMKFVAAVAFSKATYDEPSPKRKSTDEIILENDIDSMICVLKAQATGSNSIGRTSIAVDLNSNSLSEVGVFWKFVGWALQIMNDNETETDKFGYQKILQLCLENMENSGACYCLSVLLSKLLTPEIIASHTVQSITTVLHKLADSQSPPMSSGALHLINSLSLIKIQDSKFQELKKISIFRWYQTRVLDCAVLSTEIFAPCQPAYLEADIAEDLESVNTTLAFNAAKDAWDPKILSSRKSCFVDSLEFSDITLKQASNVNAPIRDILWDLACRARLQAPVVNYTISRPYVNLDGKAVVWFANLASYLDWPKQYCSAALALASNLPLTTEMSIETSLSLLTKPSKAITAMLTHYVSPVWNTLTGVDLRGLQPFLQTYKFQKSPFISLGILKLLYFNNDLKSSNEGAQLVTYFETQTSGMSECSKLLRFIKQNNSKTAFDNFDLAVKVFDKKIGYTRALMMEFNHHNGMHAPDIKKWSAISNTSQIAFLYAIATPLMVATTTEYSAILKCLGASEDLLAKQKSLETAINSSSSADTAIICGLMQQILLDHSQLTTTDEKESVILFCYNRYVAATENLKIINCFWAYSCALSRSQNPDACLRVLKKLATDSTSLSTESLLCLYSAGFDKNAIRSQSKKILLLPESFSVEDIGDIVSNVSERYEVCHYVFNELADFLTSADQAGNIDMASKFFTSLGKRKAWNWSKKLGLTQLNSRNVNWLSLLGRVGPPPDLEDELRGDFVQMLRTVYEQLPYDEKWYLNTFICELRTSKFALEIDMPKIGCIDLPLIGVPVKTEHFQAGSIINEIIEYWDLPKMGVYIVQKIPQLVSLVPQLVSTFRKVPQKIIEIVEISLMNEDTMIFALKILRKYVEVNKTVFCDTDVALTACIQANQPQFTILGFLITELKWNQRLPVNEKHLQTFYSRLPDEGYKDAMKKTTDVLNMTVESKWQQLQFDLIKNEVLSTPIEPTFEHAGLWQLACKNTGYNFYDCEKTWWLNEWESLNLSQQNLTETNETLINPEFGVLIGFFKQEIDVNQAYAQLALCNPKFCSTFQNIISHARIDSANTVVRRGREVRFEKIVKNDLALCNELKLSCEQLRKEKDIYGSMEYLIKLNSLAQKVEINKEVLLTAKIQSAHTAWSLNKPETAIMILKETIANSDTWLPVEVCTLASWSHLAREEGDECIMNLFEKAIELSSTSTSEFIHHSFAYFCETRYRDDVFNASIEDSRRAIDSEMRQVQFLKKLVTESVSNGGKDPALLSRVSQAQRMLDSESNNYTDLQNKKQRLLTRCLKSYLVSLHAGGSFDQDMTRFLSLWLENCENKNVNKIVYEGIMNGPPTRKYLPWMNQLTSRLGNRDAVSSRSFQKPLQALILKACIDHPHHVVWQLINILKRKQDTASMDRMLAAENILRRGSVENQLINRLVTFAEQICEFGKSVQRKRNHSLPTWWIKELVKLRVPLPTTSVPVQSDFNYTTVPYIHTVLPEYEVAGGLSAPIVISIIDSSGGTQKMLLKSSKKDDLRQDAIMEQLFSTVNTLLTTKNSQLKVRTYTVIPLGDTFGAIEFVKGTKSLIEVLEPLHNALGGDSEYTKQTAVSMLNQKRDAVRSQRVELFKKVMSHTEPQLRHFWPRNSKSLRDWLAIQTAWSRSNGVMSIVGYIIGLGDRHCSNLLLDTKTGEVVHIDLGIAFDQGRMLHIPETVPFRLTRDMVDGMGVQKTVGVFGNAAKKTLRTIGAEQDVILAVLEVLTLDSLYSWKLPDHRALESSADIPEAEKRQAEIALTSVKHKLNLEMSPEAIVRDLVAKATDIKNLAVIYPGWCPFY